MITTEKKHFLRIILLLYDAASFILRHIVARELEKQGDDLDNLLKKGEFENKLKHKLHFGKSQVEKLFPSNGKSDINTWDSQMLAVVCLLIFRSTLSSDEKYHINFIKLTRNNVAHKPSASYLEEDFVDEKDVIVKAITTLASSFDTTVQENCRKLISSYCSDPLDSHVQLAIKHLEEDTNNSELLRQILDAVNQKHEIIRNDVQGHAERIENKINLTEKKICQSQETVLSSLNGICLVIGNVESKVTESKENSSQELKQVTASLTNHIVNEAEKVSQKVDSSNSLLQEVQRNQNEHAAKLESKLQELKQLFEQTSRIGGHCSKQIKFGQHTHLTVDGPTQEWINIVETVLKSVFDLLLNEVQEPGQNPETEKAVEEFLNFIKGFKGVELKAVERKCILFAFECLTFESLRELIEFINSNEFHKYLVSIARALEKDLQIPEQILISSEIPISSLQLVVDDKSFKHESEKGIVLSFECTSINGLDAFWRLFVKGEATPYIDKIAATLSSEVREKTSISTSVNQQEFEDALTHLEATVNRDKETVLFKPNNETTRQSSDFELDIDTLETRTVYMSQDSHTKLIDPPMHQMDTFQNIQADQADLKQGDSNSHPPSSPSSSYLLRSVYRMSRNMRESSSQIRCSTEMTSPFKGLPQKSVKIETETLLFKPKSKMTQQSLDIKEDIDTVATRTDVSPGDLGENSQSLPNRTPSFKKHKPQPEIKSAGAQYGEKHPINLTQTAQISFSHQQYKLSLVYKKEINLQHDSSKYCVVSLCAVLSHGRIMILREKTLTRVYNLKVVNIHTGFVEQWKSLHSRPSDIAALPNDQVAVTLPSDNVIEILSTNEKSVIRSIPVEKHPSGITYHQDELYVVCEQFDNRPIVNVFNMQGDFVRKVELDIEQLSTLNLKIAVSTDLQSLYVADYWSGSLISFSSHGKVTARYRFGLLCPKGLTMLDDGSLLFFSEKSDPIRHISADLQQDYVLEVDKGYIYYMGFDLVNKHIYVCFRYDIYVYCLEEQSNKCLKAETNITSLQDEDKSSSFKTEDSLASLETIYKSSSHKTQSKLVSHKTKNKLRSLKTEERLGSVKTEDKLSSLKTEDKLSSLKTEDNLGSLKSEDTLSSLKTEGKLTSLKAEDMLSFLKTEEKLGSLKDEDTLSSLKTLEKLSFAKAEDKLSSLKTKDNISSLKTEERLGSLKTGDKLSSFKTEDKLRSLKTEDSLSSLKTEDKLSSLKTEGKLTSLKTEDKLSSLKTEDKLSTLQTEDKLSSLKTEGMLTSLETEDKLSCLKTEDKLISSLITKYKLSSLQTKDKSSSVNTKENKVNAFTAEKDMSSSKSDKTLTNFREKKIHYSEICELS